MKSVTFNVDKNQILYYEKDEVKYDSYLSVVTKYLYGGENIKEEIEYMVLKSGKKIKRD